MPNPAVQQSVTHHWIRNPVKWGNRGWRFCRELDVHSDVLPAFISVHLGSEAERLAAQGLGEMPIR